MKKFFILLLSFLASCSFFSKSPEKTFNQFMAAMQSGNYDEAEKLLNSTGSLKVADPIQEQILKALTSHLTYRVTGVQQYDDVVVVSAEIESIDMRKTMISILNEISSDDFKKKMDEQAVSQKAKTDPANAQKIVAEMNRDIFIRNINNPSALRVKNEIQVTMVRQDGIWKLNDSDELANAITGGMLTGIEGR